MDAVWWIPIGIVVLLAVGVVVFGRQATKANIERHGGDLEATMSDDEASIPATPFIPDPATALGDTAEAHDTLSPHDVPLDNPGRPAVERAARREGGGTTDGG